MVYLSRTGCVRKELNADTSCRAGQHLLSGCCLFKNLKMRGRERAWRICSSGSSQLSPLFLSPLSFFVRRVQRADTRYLVTHHPHLTLLAEAHTINDHPSYPLVPISHADSDLLSKFTDLVITLGGDGTILHTSHLFDGGECPPVLSFSLGSLGFLLPFRGSSFSLTVKGGFGEMVHSRPLAWEPH